VPDIFLSTLHPRLFFFSSCFLEVLASRERKKKKMSSGSSAAERKLAALGPDARTPAFCVDFPTVERNCAALGAWCASAGLAHRPHFKTHKLASVAAAQLASGAVGLVVSTVAEARALAEAGGDSLWVGSWYRLVNVFYLVVVRTVLIARMWHSTHHMRSVWDFFFFFCELTTQRPGAVKA
jgi:hypothetical protein